MNGSKQNTNDITKSLSQCYNTSYSHPIYWRFESTTYHPLQENSRRDKMKANARSGLLANWKIEELYVLACSLVTRFIAHILIRKVLLSTHSCQQHLEGLPKPLWLSNHLLIWTIFVRNLTHKRIPFFSWMYNTGSILNICCSNSKGSCNFQWKS